VEQVAATVLPSVVSIQLQGPTGSGEGTGVVLSSDGLILTNNHVVAGASRIEVGLFARPGQNDRQTYQAKVIGRDPLTDSALIRIAENLPFDLPTATFGDSAQVAPGDWVVAIGNPFNLTHTVTAGVISAKGRPFPVEGRIQEMLQTDTAINPGNSGGPLLNLRGEVIGINTAILSTGPNGGNVGIGFAVPINVVNDLLPQLQQGKVTRGRIGVRLQELTAELARALRLREPAGALVTMVEPSSAAQAAGLRAGDVIVRFAGKPVATHVELMRLVAASAPGASVELELLRNGAPSSAAVRIMAPEPSRARPTDIGSADRLGFQLAPLSDAQRKRLALDYGLLVQRAEGAARRAGLLPGDVILAVNGDATRSLAEFLRAVAKAASGDVVALLVERAGGRAFVPLRIP
jgi:serine protease Do